MQRVFSWGRISVLLFLSLWGRAQTVRQPLISTYPGMGAYSKSRADVFSMVLNPAALANVRQAGAGVYSERRFLLSALQQYTAGMALPTASGTFGLQADYFGFNAYNETQLGLGYGRSLGSKVDVGAKFNYYNLRIPGYQSASTIHFEAGVVMHLSDKVHAAFSTYNPVGGVINKLADEKLASVHRGGIGYEVSDRFFIMGEIIKEEGRNVGVNAGFEYNLATQLLVRGGVNTVTSQPFVGAGLRLGTLRVDVATYYHPQLGITPAVMLLFDFKKPEANP
ncbi:MAG: hypothetical protein ACK4E8_11000 [Lacibacter sp.]|jgi:hypothetical protein